MRTVPLNRSWFTNFSVEPALQPEILGLKLHPHSTDILEPLTLQMILYKVGAGILHSVWDAGK
jgi:hypothetical protein